MLSRRPKTWQYVDKIESILFEVGAPTFSKDSAVERFIETGVIVLRGLFAEAQIDALDRDTQVRLKAPTVSGSAGYFKPDHPKKFVDPFSLGGAAVDVALDEQLSDIVEAYMGSECILSEATIKYDAPTTYEYFGLHSDYAVGTRRHANSDTTVTPEMMGKPLGVGAAVYFHDCIEGAFSYSFGSHIAEKTNGQKLDEYPDAYQQAIMESWVRVEGKRGDVVVFDDRGFHGPAQPARASRLVMLLDWMNVSCWGRVQVRPFPVLTTDIGRLSDRQLRLAGVGGQVMTTLDEYHMYRSFSQRRPMAHRLAARIVENAYWVDDLKARTRNALRRLLR
jgi:hypothetical protein